MESTDDVAAAGVPPRPSRVKRSRTPATTTEALEIKGLASHVSRQPSCPNSLSDPGPGTQHWCMQWVTVSTQFSPAEAELLRSRLEASGFLVTLKNLGAALAMDGYTMATGGILVQVPENQAEDARLLLTAEPSSEDPDE